MVGKFLLSLSAGALALYTSAITMSGGLVTYGSSDGDVINVAVGNTLTNLWAGLTFIAPYVGMAAGFVLVIGLVKYAARKFGAH